MRIGLDFDGVITDCGKLKKEGAMRLFGITIPEEKFKKEIVIAENLLTEDQYRSLQKEIYDNPNIGLLAESVEGMKEYVQTLQEKGHTLTIITSRSAESLEVAKEWLKIKNIELPIVGVGQEKTKENACRNLQLDIFVDDDLDKLQPLIDCVPHLFLFSWGYNLHIDPGSIATRVLSWSDLYKKITTLEN